MAVKNTRMDLDKLFYVSQFQYSGQRIFILSFEVARTAILFLINNIVQAERKQVYNNYTSAVLLLVIFVFKIHDSLSFFFVQLLVANKL